MFHPKQNHLVSCSLLALLSLSLYAIFLFLLPLPSVSFPMATSLPVLYKEPLVEGQPNPWAIKLNVGGRVYQVETKGCWENLEARFALICKICILDPCPGSETSHLIEMLS